MTPPDQAKQQVKFAIQTATEMANEALKRNPSMSEITVEYQGVKITLKRNKEDDYDECGG